VRIYIESDTREKGTRGSCRGVLRDSLGVGGTLEVLRSLDCASIGTSTVLKTF